MEPLGLELALIWDIVPPASLCLYIDKIFKRENSTSHKKILEKNPKNKNKFSR